MVYKQELWDEAKKKLQHLGQNGLGAVFCPETYFEL